ncbi:uncharacterized protein LOC110457936 isoform X2 [Mizuhopecten yessoensis]|uniref:uncharacterized protein LOC110457936 isoform X2 n=1 Tax=Mizuhopecten yessoensis TaxID=6573 RepID=UPI000B459BA1|nr:uncharacterized protein LOC110457936 isoform X2 [Mizuhopecten yessoensis]
MGRHPFGTKAFCPFKGLNGRFNIHLYVSEVIVTEEYFTMSMFHVQYNYNPNVKTHLQLECVSWYILYVPIVVEAYIVQDVDYRYKSFERLSLDICDVNRLVKAGFSCTDHRSPIIECTACGLLLNLTSLQETNPYGYHLRCSPNCEFFQENRLQNGHLTMTNGEDTFARERTNRSLQPSTLFRMEKTDNATSRNNTDGIKANLKREKDRKVPFPNGNPSFEMKGVEQISHFNGNLPSMESQGAQGGATSNTTYSPPHMYLTEQDRIASFQHHLWPKENVHQLPKELAEAGFYYTGKGDEVKCHICDVTVSKWKPSDDPWKKHRSVCQFVTTNGPQNGIQVLYGGGAQSSTDLTNNGSTDPPVWCAVPNNDNMISRKETVRENENIAGARGGEVSCPIRSSRYTEQNARRETYLHWPHRAEVDIDYLVKAGFFYTGEEDIVRCFYCDIGLAEWNPDDDPWVEHARHSPECPYLRDEKGQDYINNIQTQWARVNKLVYPRFTQRGARRRTFENLRWPRDERVQTPEQLAVAGFFYTGVGDYVQCFYCGGGLSCWEPDDDPWLEHAHWFPYCKFVLKMKGRTFIQVSDAANTAGEAPMLQPAAGLTCEDDIHPNGNTTEWTEDEEEIYQQGFLYYNPDENKLHDVNSKILKSLDRYSCHQLQDISL